MTPSPDSVPSPVKDPPPPKRDKRRLPRGRHGVPKALIRQSQRERTLEAIVRVAAVKGYEGTTVAAVLDVAGIGRETFYELFAGKRDCFLAAHAVLFNDMLAKATAAYEQPGSWPERARRGLSAVLRWFSADPDVARVMMIEVAAVGPTFQERFHANFDAFVDKLDEGREQAGGPPCPPNVSSLAAGAVFARIYEEVVLGRTAELPRLLPRLTFQLLLPFVGEESARKQEREAREEAQP